MKHRPENKILNCSLSYKYVFMKFSKGKLCKYVLKELKIMDHWPVGP